ncbi:D-alanyl-D-alanine carboxypeptidase/D-alanyl-D-alanine-endopeptidase [Streptomyces sp. CB03238]|uniref:D-alanyl-D-alanine carboxypeptidase/D-alanyl-D-alanine endopeptidase n=1 Tax=Streptomyces sp. CB03238 TaxID=1907777 RepID=UPI000A10F87E|nr:D-alanyl-D-alanine carboxypeptidase/D-alanyl-D-alanine-endopeptidase [Streptomyces sp. CB03238]ORT59000.1 D-alanyl-D-alanine carboxypeptidase/D-alanyl-D-alanine-endopeptidase [Streptomyces sp. CB03238]
MSRHVTRVTALALGLAGLLAGSSLPAGAGPSDTGLKGAIDTILADPRLDGGAASVVVADASSGDTLYQRDAGDRLMPASNTKIPTSVAAMALLGPEYRFRTEVLSTAGPKGGVLHGDLYVRGTGDPTTLAKDYDALAARVAASGIRRVTGRLVADDTRFDTNRLGRSWAADDESSYYSAQISPLTVAPDTDYDSGTVVVEAAPAGRAGAKPRVSLTPATDYVRVDNRATTVPAGRPGTLTIEREHGTNTITVAGEIPLQGSPAKEWVTVWEPTGYAAAVFTDALAAHGVRIDGPPRLGAPTPAHAKALATHSSMPLKDLMRPFMKLSNNMHAETLTKTIGYETSGRGTWSAGLAAIGTYLKEQGVQTSTVRQVDGSGLSRMNLFPAALNTRAKTGTLTGASGLSGYVTDVGGRRLVYSIVLNNHLASSVKSIEDAIVVTLARSDTAKGAITAVPPSRIRSSEPSADLECSWRKPNPC